METGDADHSRPGAMRYADAHNRRQEIVRRVRATGYAAAAALAAQLNVHEMTIRRDLHKLAEAGEVRLVHGGASLPDGAVLGEPEPAPGTELTTAAAIGGVAAGLVTPGSTIGVDSGPIGAELARQLPVDRRLTVITHSLPAMAELATRPDLTLLGLGGLYRDASRCFTGAEKRETLDRLLLDMYFLSSDTLGPDGVGCRQHYESELKRALTAAARTVVLMVASGWSDAPSALVDQVCGFGMIDVIITDEGAGADELAVLRGTGRRVEVAGPHWHPSVGPPRAPGQATGLTPGRIPLGPAAVTPSAQLPGSSTAAPLTRSPARSASARSASASG